MTFIRRHAATIFLAVSALVILVALFGHAIEFVAAALALAPFLGGWASWRLWRWHKFYGTRFLWGLFVASIAADLAALPIAFISARRIFLGPDAAPLPGAGEALGVALIVLEGVFVYLVLRWQDLDVDMKRVREGVDDSTDSTNRPPGDTYNSEDS
jgi:hypothetical protein